MAFWIPCPYHNFREDLNAKGIISKPMRVSDRTLRYRCRYCKASGIFVKQKTKKANLETSLEYNGEFYRDVPDN